MLTAAPNTHSLDTDAARGLHIAWINEAADFIGGCEQYIYNTVSLLRERGVRNSLFYDCTRPDFSTSFAKPFDHVFPMVDTVAQVKALAPDIIYVHRLAAGKAVARLRETGAPTVRFFHDYQIFCPREHRYSVIGMKTCHKPMGMRCYVPCLGVINRTDRWPGLRLNRVGRLRKAIRENLELDAFVTGSRYMAELVAAHGVDADRTHVIPLYSIPHEIPDTAPRQPGLFLFAGQLIRSKGVDTLLRALAQLPPEATLAVAGTGRHDALFKSMAVELGVADRVTFLGRLPQDALSSCYAKAGCVVVPSRYPETFGLVGVEAMRHGTPVIATAVGAMGEWLEDGKTGLRVPPNDPDAMAAAMRRMLEDPKTAAQMGSAGRARYEEAFVPERHVNSLVDCFRHLATGAAAHG